MANQALEHKCAICGRKDFDHTHEPVTNQTRTDVQRYDLVTNHRCGSSIEEMERADNGEWIRYEDVAARLVALEREREELKLANILQIAHEELKQRLATCERPDLLSE